MGQTELRRAQLKTMSYVETRRLGCEAVLDQTHVSAPRRQA